MKNEQPSSKFAPTAVDQHIGARIVQRRNMLGMTQKALAEQCGITFQQMQKYEKATNRISVSRIYQIGMALDSSVAFFFSGLPLQPIDNSMFEKKPKPGQRTIYKVCEPADGDPLGRSETMNLIMYYWKLPEDARKNIMELMKTMVPKNAIKEPETTEEFHSIF